VKNFNKNCIVCNSQFSTDDDKQTWCSGDCKSKLKKLICKKCDREFYHNRNLSYCSDTCRTRECDHCSKRYLPNSNEKFCCHECKELFHTYKCKACEQHFVSKSYAPKKFCSEECRAVYRNIVKIKRTCKNCKKVIAIGNHNLIFCSDSCRVEFENKKESKIDEEKLLEIVENKVNTLLKRKETFLSESYLYTININNYHFSESLKEIVRKRDSYVCYICENSKELEIHHILPRKLGGRNEVDNLITLCVKCHRHIETGNKVYAKRKCYENAKVTYGFLNYKLEQQSSKIETLNLLENNLNNIFNKITNKDEIEEILMEFDELFPYLEKLRR
jgi:hypothetical protein